MLDTDDQLTSTDDHAEDVLDAMFRADEELGELFERLQEEIYYCRENISLDFRPKSVLRSYFAPQLGSSWSPAAMIPFADEKWAP